MTSSHSEKLLTAREVGDLFRVGPGTPPRWAKAGKLTVIRTPSGHHRFLESEISALLRGETAGA
jgi:predicted site-specific integrase-resolvase